MEKVLSDAIEAMYDSYMFFGVPKDDGTFRKEDGLPIDFAIGKEQGGVADAIFHLGMHDQDMKFFFLKAALRAFEYCNEEDYMSMMFAVKRTKRLRYRNFGVYSQTPSTQKHCEEVLARKGKDI